MQALLDRLVDRLVRREEAAQRKCSVKVHPDIMASAGMKAKLEKSQDILESAGRRVSRRKAIVSAQTDLPAGFEAQLHPDIMQLAGRQASLEKSQHILESAGRHLIGNNLSA